MTELVIVIGIVLLLLAILLPAVVNVRRSMWTTVCANNLRQIGQAINTYRAEHRVWPDASGIPLPWGGTLDRAKLPLYEALSGNLPKASPAYRCPAEAVVWQRTAAASPVGLGISYLFWIRDKDDWVFRQRMNTAPIMQDMLSDPDHVGPPHPRNSVNCLYKDGRVITERVTHGG